MAALLLGLLAVTGVLLQLTSGSSRDDGGPSRPEGTMDGVLTEVSEQELVLRRQDGGGEQRFVVRPVDARQLDLFHLETHSRNQLPSRVFFESEGDALYAVRVEDR